MNKNLSNVTLLIIGLVFILIGIVLFFLKSDITMVFGGTLGSVGLIFFIDSIFILIKEKKKTKSKSIKIFYGLNLKQAILNAFITIVLVLALFGIYKLSKFIIYKYEIYKTERRIESNPSKLLSPYPSPSKPDLRKYPLSTPFFTHPSPVQLPSPLL